MCEKFPGGGEVAGLRARERRRDETLAHEPERLEARDGVAPRRRGDSCRAPRPLGLPAKAIRPSARRHEKAGGLRGCERGLRLGSFAPGGGGRLLRSEAVREERGRLDDRVRPRAGAPPLGGHPPRWRVEARGEVSRRVEEPRGVRNRARLRVPPDGKGDRHRREGKIQERGGIPLAETKRERRPLLPRSRRCPARLEDLETHRGQIRREGPARPTVPSVGVERDDGDGRPVVPPRAAPPGRKRAQLGRARISFERVRESAEGRPLLKRGGGPALDEDGNLVAPGGRAREPRRGPPRRGRRSRSFGPRHVRRRKRHARDLAPGRPVRPGPRRKLGRERLDARAGIEPAQGRDGVLGRLARQSSLEGALDGRAKGACIAAGRGSAREPHGGRREREARRDRAPGRDGRRA